MLQAPSKFCLLLLCIFYFYHDLEVNDVKIAKLLCRNQCCHFDQTKKMCPKLEYQIISSLN